MREREGQGKPEAVFPPRSLLGSAATRKPHTEIHMKTHSLMLSRNNFEEKRKRKQPLCVCCFSGVSFALKCNLLIMKSPVCFLTGRMELIHSVTVTQVLCAELRMSLDSFLMSELVFFWILLSPNLK